MSKSTHRVLALFAATALTASSLAACAPKGVVRTSPQNTAPNATSQPSENAGTAQKPTTSQTAQPDTTNTNSNSTSSNNNSNNTNAAPTNSNSNNSTTSTAAPSNSTTSANSTSTNAAPTSTTNTNAAPTQTGITGWLTASCREGSNQYGPDVTSATLYGETFTLEGNMAFSESGPASSFADSSSWISGPIVLAVDSNTRWEGRGGAAPPQELDPEKILHVINTHGGLGLVIEVENSVAKTIAMCS